MWKISKGLSSFSNYLLMKKIRYAFSFDRKNGRNLIGFLSIEGIYKFCLGIAICINKVKRQMYNPEKIGIFLRENTKKQPISVEEIHNTTDLITTLGNKSIILYS